MLISVMVYPSRVYSQLSTAPSKTHLDHVHKILTPAAWYIAASQAISLVLVLIMLS